MELERFLLWIESQSPFTIVLITFGLCYAVVIAIFVFCKAFIRKNLRDELKSMTPVMLTPLAVLTGLVIAFIASRVWANFDRANALVRDEVRSIQTSLALAETLPPNVTRQLRSEIRQYLQFTETDDWPAMLQGHAKMGATVPGLTNAMSTVLSFVPSEEGQKIAQQRTLIALEQALDARQNRILISGALVMPVQWMVVIVLAVLTLFTVALVHVDRPHAMAASLFSLSTALAACLCLLLVNDRPFSAGGLVVRPEPFRQIVVD
jgi:hypothetical protein